MFCVELLTAGVFVCVITDFEVTDGEGVVVDTLVGLVVLVGVGLAVFVLVLTGELVIGVAAALSTLLVVSGVGFAVVLGIGLTVVEIVLTDELVTAATDVLSPVFVPLLPLTPATITSRPNVPQRYFFIV